MKTLVTDDFAERPVGPTVVVGTTATANMSNFSLIVTTGGYVAGDPPPPEVYRTQAFVDKHLEITDGQVE